MISLQNVNRYYEAGERSVHALDRVSLTIARHEFVAVVGPSGCGKSTLLHLIAGLDRPTAGEVLLDGRPVSAPGTDRILIFQELGLFPWLNVLENVEFVLRMADEDKQKRRATAREYLRLVHLATF